MRCEIDTCNRFKTFLVEHPSRGELFVCGNHAETIVQDIDGEVVELV